MSDNIQQLKKKNINSDLDKILGDVKSDQAELLVTLSKLSFLTKLEPILINQLQKKHGILEARCKIFFFQA